MTITLILTNAVAQDLRRQAPSTNESQMILETVKRFDGSIVPTHLDGEQNPALARVFNVEVRDSDTDLVAETLLDLEGVEASYVKPRDELP